MRWGLTRIVTTLGALAGLYLFSTQAIENVKEYPISILMLCGIYGILAVSLNLINGVTGQFSIGHAGFFAIGAYLGGMWAATWQPIAAKSLPFLASTSLSGDAINILIATLFGATGAGLAGFLVGLPSLRLRGDYLAIVTLGFGEVIRIIILNIEAVGGPRGLSPIPTLIKRHDLALFWIFGGLALTILFSRSLLRSIRGLTWLAVREDEIAADAMGVNTTKVKVTAFVIGSAFAGMAGALLALYSTGVSPDSFDMNTSISITTMVVLGGTGSVTGSLLAAFALTALPEALRDTFPVIKEYRMVIYSILLVVMMLVRPQGIFGHRELSLKFLTRRRIKQGGTSA